MTANPFGHTICSVLLHRHCLGDLSSYPNLSAGNPRVTPEVTRDVLLLSRLMAANLYFHEIE